MKIKKINIESGEIIAEYNSVEEAAVANFMKIGELLEHLHGWLDHQDEFYFEYVK
ncbi:MAG: hypothetical protein ACRDCC_09900 [Culicoidibacterales bacterium]